MRVPVSLIPHQQPRPATFALALLLLPVVIGLPIAVWLDLRSLSARMMQGEASEIGLLIDEMRAYYANEVLGRLEGHGREAPMPTALSIELGKRISARDGAVKIRIFSDFPFRKRPGHPIDAFEQTALERLRQDATKPVVDVSGTLVDRTVRVATPIVMGPACVACHNSHPDSPKQNWRVGDVRGVQEVTVRRPIEASIFSFKALLAYIAVVAACGLAFIRMQSRQAALVRHMNGELAQANAFLGSVSAKIARYLSPQVYRSIFSGAKDVAITAERKKLTIVFSDIKDFTALTERLQPEDLTALLNEYFTEMSVIALRHGATIDKFVGDAMLLFFGDPDTRGVREDAAAAVRMALDMQAELARLNAEWRKRGLAEPLEVRMGINTGYCHVGNFGSDNRMDYTIIGAEANLAARLQAVAQPGSIIISYETYALVRDIVEADALPPITVKGISRPVVPYVVRRLAKVPEAGVIHGQAQGLDLFLDVTALDAGSAGETRRLLEQALTALDTRAGQERPRAM